MKIRGKKTCPECGDNYIHFYKLDVLHNESDTYEVRRYGFKLFERGCGEALPVEPDPTERSNYRGGGVEVTFHCEGCAFFWKESMYFHKGWIFTHLDGLPEEEVFR